MKKILKKRIKYLSYSVQYFSSELVTSSTPEGTHPWYGALTCSVGCPEE